MARRPESPERKTVDGCRVERNSRFPCLRNILRTGRPEDYFPGTSRKFIIMHLASLRSNHKKKISPVKREFSND